MGGPRISSTQVAVVVTVILISLCSVAEGLQCIQCSATKIDMPCITDTEGMANLTTRRDNYYEKNCTGTNGWDRCVIMAVASNGQVTIYIRDCHDGKYFPTDYFSPVFVNLTTDNQTTCEAVKDKIVCYTFCNTDYCNGPRPFIEKNCTALGEDEEGCGACGVFARSELIVLEMLAALISLVVARDIFFG